VRSLAKLRLAFLSLAVTVILMVVLVPVMSRLNTGGKPLGPVYARADIEAGRVVYQDNCAACHGADARGNPDMKVTMPKLDIRAAAAGSPDTLKQVIHNGKGAMPAFTTLSEEQVRQVLAFLKSLGEGQ